MNNLTLAGEGFTYYETIGGGQGACPDADGPSAIHVAMSNTLNTPVEALETEFPLRVRELSVRRGSGGAGRHRGGDGIVREIEALAPMRFTLIAERRRHAPAGPRRRRATASRGATLLNGEPLPGKAEGELRARRPAANRDPGRRRVRSEQVFSGRSRMSRVRLAGQPGLHRMGIGYAYLQLSPELVTIRTRLVKAGPSSRMRASEGLRCRNRIPPPIRIRDQLLPDTYADRFQGMGRNRSRARRG